MTGAPAFAILGVQLVRIKKGESHAFKLCQAPAQGGLGSGAVAVLILAVTLLELFLLGEGTLSQVLGGSFSADAFFADAMTIVVGIEFVKMLMLHTPRAVTDVLLFAIARQLVVNHSSAVDTLLGVAAVALIFVIKKFLHTDGDDAPAGDGRP